MPILLLTAWPAPASPVTVPFEIVNKKVFLKVHVDGSRPLSFVGCTTGRPSGTKVPGRAFPIRLSQGHPLLEAEVTPVGRPPIKGDFVLDLGAGGALALYSPFVAEHRLLSADMPTVEALGVRGAGGVMAGRVGRVAALRIGGFTLSRPITHFSLDQAGAFAGTAIQRNIGHEIASRFRLFLDYGNERIVFEPAPSFGESFDRPQTGLVIEAEGTDYRTFRVTDVLEGSPGSEAGVRPGDVVTAIEGRAAAEWTLSDIFEHLERTAACMLTIRRGPQTLALTLTPRPLF
jgi:hypothetical protein